MCKFLYWYDALQWSKLKQIVHWIWFRMEKSVIKWALSWTHISHSIPGPKGELRSIFCEHNWCYKKVWLFYRYARFRNFLAFSRALYSMGWGKHKIHRVMWANIMTCNPISYTPAISCHLVGEYMPLHYIEWHALCYVEWHAFSHQIAGNGISHPGAHVWWKCWY